jgi:hypothetical protein
MLNLQSIHRHINIAGYSEHLGADDKYLDRVAMHFEDHVLMPCILLRINGKLRILVKCGSGVNCR